MLLKADQLELIVLIFDSQAALNSSRSFRECSDCHVRFHLYNNFLTRQFSTHYKCL